MAFFAVCDAETYGNIQKDPTVVRYATLEPCALAGGVYVVRVSLNNDDAGAATLKAVQDLGAMTILDKMPIHTSVFQRYPNLQELVGATATFADVEREFSLISKSIVNEWKGAHELIKLAGDAGWKFRIERPDTLALWTDTRAGAVKLDFEDGHRLVIRVDPFNGAAHFYSIDTSAQVVFDCIRRGD